MAIGSDLIRGHIDTIILRFLNSHDTYGYEINAEIRKLSEGKYEIKEATLYSAFRRLEENNMITSYWGDSVNGARRRYYSITEKGKEYYRNSLEEWNASREIIERLIKDEK